MAQGAGAFIYIYIYIYNDIYTYLLCLFFFCVLGFLCLTQLSPVMQLCRTWKKYEATIESDSRDMLGGPDKDQLRLWLDIEQVKEKAKDQLEERGVREFSDPPKNVSNEDRVALRRHVEEQHDNASHECSLFMNNRSGASLIYVPRPSNQAPGLQALHSTLFVWFGCPCFHVCYLHFA